MNPIDHDETVDEKSRSSNDAQPEVISTTDPGIEVGRSEGYEQSRPDQTIVTAASPSIHDVPVQILPIEVVPGPTQKPIERDLREKQVSRKDDSPSESKPHDEVLKTKQPPHGKTEGEHRWLSLVLTAVVALVCGVGGAWAFSHFEQNANHKDQSKSAAKSGKGGGSTNDDSSNASNDAMKDQSSEAKNPKSDMASEVELNSLKREIDEVSGKLMTLKDRFESFTGLRNDTVRDIGTMQVQIKEMSHNMDEIRDVPKRMQPLEAQLARLQEVVDRLSFQIASRSEVRPAVAIETMGDRKNRDVNTPAVSSSMLTSPMIPADPALADATMASAISFFKRGTYIQAESILKDLRVSKSDDARVWYLSALAHGLVTNTWDGETLRYVTSGAEREAKGSPPLKEIDQTFAFLSPEQGSDWLRAYRARLVKH